MIPCFVSFEGIDGSGKSTQTQHFAAALQERGARVVTTREPGGSTGAEEIRQLLLNGAPDRWSPEAELLLFCAARRDHLERIIDPALARGDWVICDRFVDSTRVYQGTRAPHLRHRIDELHEMMVGREPDLTFLIDIDPAVGLKRALARADDEARFEKLGADLHTRMRNAFLKLAEDNPERFAVIDGAGAPDIIAARVMTAFETWLARK